MNKSSLGDNHARELQRLREKVAELESAEQKAREELEGSQTALREMMAVFDGIDEPIYVADPKDHEVLFVNQAARRMWGEGVGRKCYHYLQGRDAPCPFCTNNIIFDERPGQTHVWEFLNLRMHRWFRCIDRAIRWPDGRMVRYEMAIDITVRREAEAALAWTKDRLDMAVEAAQLGMADWNLKTGEMTPNRHFARMLGYSQEELGSFLRATDLETAWESFVHQDDLPPLRAALKSNLSGEAPNIETEVRFLAKDGQWRWVLARGMVVEWDEAGLPLRMTGTILDTHERRSVAETLRRAHEELEMRVAERTAELAAANELLLKEIAERRQAESALRQSEETARALLNVTTEAAILLELDSTIVTLNETAAERLGGTVEELVGRRCFDLMPPELAASRRVFGEAAYREKRAVRFQDEKGGRLTDTNVRPVFDAEGNVVRLAIFNRDVTEVKIAEEKLRREQQLLHQLLDFHERERQLVSYEIHDGLAQELTGAIFRFQAFREMLVRDPDEAWKAFDVGVTLLGQGIKEARGLIAGLRPPILDELGIVAAVEYLACESSEQEGPEIEFRHDPRVEHLTPSLQTAVFRIVQESLNNARRHSRSDRVLLELRQDESMLHIDIRDWGVGFDPERVEDQRFGLESLRERARLLGGRTTVQSRPGEGTHLHVELPIVTRAE